MSVKHQRLLFLGMLFVPAAVILFFPSAQTLANILTHPWKRDVTYFVESKEYTQDVRMAINRWEATGLPIRFSEGDRESADLIITDRLDKKSLFCDNSCIGLTSLPGDNNLIRQTYIYLEKKMNPGIDPGYLETVTHEIGHFLGLWHIDSECSTMSSGIFQRDDCSTSDLRIAENRIWWSCGPYPDDIKALESEYDFKAQFIPSLCSVPIKEKRVSDANELMNDINRYAWDSPNDKFVYDGISLYNKNKLMKRFKLFRDYIDSGGYVFLNNKYDREVMRLVEKKLFE